MAQTDNPNRRGDSPPDLQRPADNRASTSWWQTLPGVLTGAGAVITAVTGLIIALPQFGSRPAEVDPPGLSAPIQAEPATQSGAPDPTIAAPTSGGAVASGRPVVVPGGSYARFDGINIEIEVLSAALEPYSADAKVARFKLRFRNNGDDFDRTNYTNVRLVVGGQEYAPEDSRIEQIEVHNFREFDYEFRIPIAATQAMLRLIRGDASRDLPPLDLRSPA